MKLFRIGDLCRLTGLSSKTIQRDSDFKRPDGSPLLERIRRPQARGIFYREANVREWLHYRGLGYLIAEMEQLQTAFTE